MLLKGDKIKLVKEIDGFNKVGEIFEVTDVLENGMISFRCWFGTGLMSYSEFEEYFRKIVIKQWSNWASVDFSIDGAKVIFDTKCDSYAYRTNGKKIELKFGDIKVCASCKDCDEFDLVKGLRLCYVRIKVKEIMKSM